MEFGYGYQNKCKEQFGDSKETNYYGFLVKIYDINSFISLHGYELDELLKFVSEQLDDFDTEYNKTEIEEY